MNTMEEPSGCSSKTTGLKFLGTRGPKYLDKRIRKLVKDNLKVKKEEQSSTFHVHVLLDKNKSCLFKLLWSLLVLSTSFLFIYQTKERIEYLISDPVRTITKFASPNEDSGLEASFMLTSWFSRRFNQKLGICLNIFEFVELYANNQKRFKKVAETTDQFYEEHDFIKDIELVFKNPKWKTSVETNVEYDTTGKQLHMTFKSFHNGFFRDFEIRVHPVAECKPEEIPDFLIATKRGHSKITEKRDVLLYYQHVELVIYEIQKNIRINRASKPCVDAETAQNCVQDILRKLKRRYRQKSIQHGECDCRMPHDDVNTAANATVCSIPRSLDCLLADENVLFADIYLFYHRYCVVPCEESLFFSNVRKVASQTNETTIRFHIQSNVVIYTEIRFHSFINLLCEIGGFSGLYFGLSVLSTIDMFSTNQKLFSNLKTKKPPDFIRDKVKRTLDKELKKSVISNKLSNVFKTNQPKQSPFLRLIRNHVTSLIMGLLFLCLATSCVIKYSKVPIVHLLETSYDKVTEVTPVYFCHESDETQILKALYRQVKSLPPTMDIPLWKMVGFQYQRSKITAAQLWNATSTLPKNFTLSGFDGESVNVTNNLSPLGSCQWQTEGEVYVVFQFLQRKQQHDFRLTLGVTAMDDTNDVYETQPETSRSQVKTYTFQYFRLTTKENPCSERATTVQCKNSCHQDASRAVLCSLPYMLHTKVKECTTAKDANVSRSLYQQGYDKCVGKCPQPCRISHIQMHVLTNPAPSTLPDGNVRWVLSLAAPRARRVTITQERVYPFVVLLTDFGNMLGITVGMCILTSFRFMF